MTSHFCRFFNQNSFSIVFSASQLNWDHFGPSYQPPDFKNAFSLTLTQKGGSIKGQIDISMSQHLLSSFLSFTQYWEFPFKAVLGHF